MFLYNHIFLFYIAFNVIANVISPINSTPSSQKLYQENDMNHLLQLDKNYCKSANSPNQGPPIVENKNDLITAIIRQMQENGDGTLSCISIFADDDDLFAQGTIKFNYVLS